MCPSVRPLRACLDAAALGTFGIDVPSKCARESRFWRAGGIGTQSPKLVSCLDQGAEVPRFHDRMARVRCDVQFGLRPRAMQVPGARHRANNVIAALHNYARN